MTVEQAKKEIQILNTLCKKLVELNDEQRGRVINSMLTMYVGDRNDILEEVKTLMFCIQKLSSLGEKEGQAIVKFLVDRFIPARFDAETEAPVEQ